MNCATINHQQIDAIVPETQTEKNGEKTAAANDDDGNVSHQNFSCINDLSRDDFQRKNK